MSIAAGRGRPWTRLVSIALAVTLILASCGDDDDDTAGGTAAAQQTTAATGSTVAGGAGTTAAGDDADPQGVLRIPQDLTSAGGVKLDPAQMNTPTDLWIPAFIYGTLLRYLDDGTYEPGLAEEATITDPSTIEITLRDGLTFQDGTPLDAEAVKFSIERTIAANKPQTFRMAELSQVDTITVDSPTELTISLKAPIAGSFYNLLSSGETMVVSPTAAQGDLHANPVGAGPFKYVSFTPEQSIVLERWDGYYAADEVKVGRIEIVQTASTEAVLNALQSGQIDVAPLTHASVAELEGVDGIVTEERKSPDTVLWLSLQCSANPAFQDVRVRQALNFATDKEALNQLLYDGQGEPMSQFWSSEVPFFNPDIANAYDYDPDRARQLLAEAGQQNLELSMVATPATPQSQRFAELLQAQWAEVGVTVTLVPTVNTIQDYYLDKRIDSSPTPQSRFWTDKVTRNFVPGSVGNTCDPQSPEFTELVGELRAVDPQDPAAVDAWHAVSAFLSEGAYGVWGVIGTVAVGWNEDRVGNPAWVPSQLGSLYPDVHRIYVKRS